MAQKFDDRGGRTIGYAEPGDAEAALALYGQPNGLKQEQGAMVVRDTAAIQPVEESRVLGLSDIVKRGAAAVLYILADVASGLLKPTVDMVRDHVKASYKRFTSGALGDAELRLYPKLTFVDPVIARVIVERGPIEKEAPLIKLVNVTEITPEAMTILVRSEHSYIFNFRSIAPDLARAALSGTSANLFFPEVRDLDRDLIDILGSSQHTKINLPSLQVPSANITLAYDQMEKLRSLYDAAIRNDRIVLNKAAKKNLAARFPSN